MIIKLYKRTIRDNGFFYGDDIVTVNKHMLNDLDIWNIVSKGGGSK
jgi:hypothetical protein